jgi:CheY-like chemotaxis protein
MKEDKMNNLNQDDNTDLLQSKSYLPSILLVEDDAINASVIKNFLKRNFNVDIAFTSTSCIEMVKKYNYVLILLDINLGHGMNGIDVLNEIRKIPGYISTPIIASTAYAMKGDKEKLLNAGFNDYISKPYMMIEIIHKVQQYVKEQINNV